MTNPDCQHGLFIPPFPEYRRFLYKRFAARVSLKESRDFDSVCEDVGCVFSGNRSVHQGQ